MNKVSIGIVTRNRVDSLEETLESIVNLTIKPYEVIIVDNNTEKNLQNLIKKYRNRLNIRYSLVKQTGIALCRNEVLDTAKGSIVSFVDDDCILQQDWYDKMIKNFSNDRVVLVVGRSGNFFQDNPVSILEGDIYNTWMSQYINPDKKVTLHSGMFVNTRNLSFRLGFVRKSKVRFNIHAPFKVEDTDFGVRLYEYTLKRKMKMIYDPGVFLLHKNSTNFIDFMKRRIYSKKGEEWLIKKYPGYQNIRKKDDRTYEKLMDKNLSAKIFFTVAGFFERQKKRIDYFLRYGKILWKIES